MKCKIFSLNICIQLIFRLIRSGRNVVGVNTVHLEESRSEMLTHMAAMFIVGPSHFVKAISQERLEKISSNLAQIFAQAFTY